MIYSGKIVSVISLLGILSIITSGESGGSLNQIRLGEHEDSDELWRRVGCIINGWQEDEDVLPRKVVI